MSASKQSVIDYPYRFVIPGTALKDAVVDSFNRWLYSDWAATALFRTDSQQGFTVEFLYPDDAVNFLLITGLGEFQQRLAEDQQDG